MYSRFHYILIAIICGSVYLIYLIGYYTIQQFQTTALMDDMLARNTHLTETNQGKEILATYIRTPAYQTQVAKAMHNKKLPGEQVINVVSPDEVDANRNTDPQTVIAEAQTRRDDPTRNMSNPEKWLYLIKRGVTE